MRTFLTLPDGHVPTRQHREPTWEAGEESRTRQKERERDGKSQTGGEARAGAESVACVQCGAACPLVVHVVPVTPPSARTRRRRSWAAAVGHRHPPWRRQGGHHHRDHHGAQPDSRHATLCPGARPQLEHGPVHRRRQLDDARLGRLPAPARQRPAPHRLFAPGSRPPVALRRVRLPDAAVAVAAAADGAPGARLPGRQHAVHGLEPDRRRLPAVRPGRRAHRARLWRRLQRRPVAAQPRPDARRRHGHGHDRRRRLLRGRAAPGPLPFRGPVVLRPAEGPRRPLARRGRGQDLRRRDRVVRPPARLSPALSLSPRQGRPDHGLVSRGRHDDGGATGGVRWR